MNKSEAIFALRSVLGYLDAQDGVTIPVPGPAPIPTPVPPAADNYPSPQSLGVTDIVRQDISFENPPGDGGRIRFPRLRQTEALIVRFVAPVAGKNFNVYITHNGGATGSSMNRTFSLSLKPGDFAIPASSDAVYAAETSSLSLRLSTIPGTYGNLVPGKTYYINMMNRAYGQPFHPAPEYAAVFITVGGF